MRGRAKEMAAGLLAAFAGKTLKFMARSASTKEKTKPRRFRAAKAIDGFSIRYRP